MIEGRDKSIGISGSSSELEVNEVKPDSYTYSAENRHVVTQTLKFENPEGTEEGFINLIIDAAGIPSCRGIGWLERGDNNGIVYYMDPIGDSSVDWSQVKEGLKDFTNVSGKKTVPTSITLRGDQTFREAVDEDGQMELINLEGSDEIEYMLGDMQMLLDFDGELVRKPYFFEFLAENSID